MRTVIGFHVFPLCMVGASVGILFGSLKSTGYNTSVTLTGNLPSSNARCVAQWCELNSILPRVEYQYVYMGNRWE